MRKFDLKNYIKSTPFRNEMFICAPFSVHYMNKQSFVPVTTKFQGQTAAVSRMATCAADTWYSRTLSKHLEHNHHSVNKYNNNKITNDDCRHSRSTNYYIIRTKWQTFKHANFIWNFYDSCFGDFHINFLCIICIGRIWFTRTATTATTTTIALLWWRQDTTKQPKRWVFHSYSQPFTCILHTSFTNISTECISLYEDCCMFQRWTEKYPL